MIAASFPHDPALTAVRELLELDHVAPNEDGEMIFSPSTPEEFDEMMRMIESLG